LLAQSRKNLTIQHLVQTPSSREPGKGFELLFVSQGSNWMQNHGTDTIDFLKDVRNHVQQSQTVSGSQQHPLLLTLIKTGHLT
jgi:hypothetical protein